MFVTFGICFKQHFDTGYLVFYNPSPPRMCLSLDILSEYRIQHGAIGPLYVTSSNSTWIFCRGVSDFATDCSCDFWCRGLTTCLRHVGPPFGNRFLNTNLLCVLTYAITYVLIHHIIFWLYLYFLNILYFFKYSCTNIFHRRSLCTFYCNYSNQYLQMLFITRIQQVSPSNFVLRRLFARTWWRHQMETFSALLVICAGNSPVRGEFPAQRPETRSFDVFFDLRLNKRLSKQAWGWWFETLSRPLWRQCNAASRKPGRPWCTAASLTAQRGACVGEKSMLTSFEQ